MYKLTQDEVNRYEALFVEALLGTISPNFRMVTIDFSKPQWRLVFILKKNNVVDREEIQESVEDFDAMIGDPEIDLDLEIIVSELPLSRPPFPIVCVFRCREQ